MAVTMSYPWMDGTPKTLAELSDTTLIYIAVESVAKQDDVELIQVGAVHGYTKESCHVIFPPSHNRVTSGDGYLDFIRMRKTGESDRGSKLSNESKYKLLLRQNGEDRVAKSYEGAWRKIISFIRERALPDEKFTLVFYSLFEMNSFMDPLKSFFKHADWMLITSMMSIACVSSKLEFLPMPDLFSSKSFKDNSMEVAALRLKQMLLDSTIVPSLTCFQLIKYSSNMFKMKWLDPGVYYLLSCHGIRSSDGSRHQSSKLQLDLQLSPTHPPGRVSQNRKNNSGKRNHECNSSSQQPKKIRRRKFDSNIKELGTRVQMPVRKETKKEPEQEKLKVAAAADEREKNSKEKSKESDIKGNKPVTAPSDAKKESSKKATVKKKSVQYLEKSEIEAGVKAFHQMLSGSKESKSEDLLGDGGSKILLQVAGIKLPADSDKHTIKAVLPHGYLPSDANVLLIVKDLEKEIRNDHKSTLNHYQDLLSQAGAEGIVEVMPLRQLRVEYKDYETKTSLCNRVERVLVDERIFRRVPTFLGKPFYKKKKLPVQINLEKFEKGKPGLNEEIERRIKTALLPLNNHGSCASVPVGRSNMTADQLVDNVMAVTEVIKNKYPGGWINVRSLNLFQNNRSLPLYVTDRSTDEVGEVTTVNTDRFKKQPVIDELSTIPGAVVTVTSHGNVKVKRNADPEWDSTEESKNWDKKKQRMHKENKNKNKKEEAKEHQDSATADAPVDQQRLDIFLAKYVCSMSETENMKEYNEIEFKNDNEMIKKEKDIDKKLNEMEITEKETVANNNPNDKERIEKETIADTNIGVQKEENIWKKNAKNNVSKTVVDKILEHLMDTSSKVKQVGSDQKSNYQKSRVSHSSVLNDDVMTTSAHGGIKDFGTENVLGNPSDYGNQCSSAQEVYVISDIDNVSSALKKDNQTFGDHDTPSYNHDTASHNQDNYDTIPQVDEAQQKEVDLMIELKTEKLKLLNELEDLLKKRRQFNAARVKE